MSFHKTVKYGSMGQVEKSGQISLSFWFDLNNKGFNEVYNKETSQNTDSKSGKISLIKILNPQQPMIVHSNGEFLHKNYSPCPVDISEITLNEQLLMKSSIKNNPNCFLKGVDQLFRNSIQVIDLSTEKYLISIILIYFLNFIINWSATKSATRNFHTKRIK